MCVFQVWFELKYFNGYQQCQILEQMIKHSRQYTSIVIDKFTDTGLSMELVYEMNRRKTAFVLYEQLVIKLSQKMQK